MHAVALVVMNVCVRSRALLSGVLSCARPSASWNPHSRAGLPEAVNNASEQSASLAATVQFSTTETMSRSSDRQFAMPINGSSRALAEAEYGLMRNTREFQQPVKQLDI